MLLRLLQIGLCAAAFLGCGKPPVNEPDPHMPLNDKFLKDRVVLLGSPIDDEEAKQVIAKLLFLEKQSKEEPITLYINSPGGSASAGVSIIRTMESLQPTIRTHCIGQAHAMAAIILAAGSRGFRSAETNALITFSRVWAGTPVPPEKQMYLDRIEEDLISTTSRLTGLTKEQTVKLFDSSNSLNPSEARDLGIIDQVR